MKLFCYGTLKRDHYNYEKFKDGMEYKVKGIAFGLSLVDRGQPYPFAVYHEKGDVVGEVFEVDMDTAQKIRVMEVGAGYEEVDVFVQTKHGEMRCKTYVAPKKMSDTVFFNRFNQGMFSFYE